MSRDIRSFFSAKPKTSTVPVAPIPSPKQSKASKRKTIVLDSDSDTDEPKPQKTLSSKLNRSTINKRRRILSSDEDEPKKTPEKKGTTNNSKPKETPEKKQKLKPVDVFATLGSSPVQRVAKQKKAKLTEKDLFNDSVADDLVLMDLDETVLDNSSNKKQELAGVKSSPKKNHKPIEINSSDKYENNHARPSSAEKHRKTESKTTNQKTNKYIEVKEEIIKSPPKQRNGKEFKEPKSEVKEDSKDLNKSIKTPDRSKPSSSKKEKKPKETEENLDYSYSDPDQERHEKKRAAGMLYKQFQSRGGPANPGSKEIPKGKPNCLNGLTFVLTGVYDSLEREEAAEIIKDLGGKTTSAISKKTSYVVAGEESGPAKLAKAEDLGTPIIDEDGLLNLIREKSGIPLKKTSTKQKEINNGNDRKTAVESPKKRVKEEPRKEDNKKDLTDGNVSKVVKKDTEDVIKVEVKKEPMVKEDVPRPWVDKYKPKSIKDIIGQQGATNNVEKLVKWLSNWHKNNTGNLKHQKPNPWAKNDDGKAYKAALLSGPPGVGKTTTAHLVSKHLGFDIIEFNASDTRNKKLLQSEVGGLLSNKTLHGYSIGNNKKLTEKQVLLMDEVDGMAGNEDRGGIQELINLIKNTSVPIICMCNDRSHQKMRSLVNYCFDLRFARPRIEQIRGAMMSICFKEKIKIPPKTIDEIILATNNDIRQTMNSISLLAAGTDLTGKSVRNDNGRKDLKMGPWEVVRKVFSAEEHKNMSLQDKSDLFFHDYSMGPLFVQQTYLTVAPKVPKSEVLKQVALTADSLTLGDMVERRIRSRMAWSMLPVQAMYSSVLPGEYMSGTITSQINFPGWLGKYSKTQKRRRLAQELHDHTRIRTSASRQSIRLDYAPNLLRNIVQPMIDEKLDGVEEALSVIKEYRLLREDLESLVELSTWPGTKSPMDSVDSKVKAALTRAYNKEVAPYTYSTVVGVKKSKASYDGDYLDDYEGDGGGAVSSSDEETNDKVENDTLIKAKKSTKRSESKGSKAGTSGISKPGGKKGSKTKKI